MMTPAGFRAESMWTPKASRAGALHSHSTLRNSTPIQTVSGMHQVSPVPHATKREGGWDACR